MVFRDPTPRGNSDCPEVVAAARRLAPAIRAAREETEVHRRTPAGIAVAMAEAGLYQMFLARSLSGPELPPLAVFAAVEELSRADGSIGWCAMIGSNNALLTGWLPPETVRAMAGTPADLRIAGSLRPQGCAWPVEGGYRVTGYWNFASGIDHATWLQCPCVLMDDETKPRTTPAGTPATRAMWVPAHAATIVDTWSVMGMRGTASQDFTLKDWIVPSDYTSSPVVPSFQTGPPYQQRAMLIALWTATVANALGIARGAIDDFVELATREATTMSTTLLLDRPLVQSTVARAEAILNAASAYVHDAVGRAWEAFQAGDLDPTPLITQARLAITHGMHEAVRTVDLVFHAAGTNAVYTRNSLERHFRDIHVAVQHGAALPGHFESAGKALMGIRPRDPGW
jgi:indole-3-acetate monooxygenase